ncbi:PfkB family carbohydrate kinase [Streptomyces sp. SAS_281]|uniref:PfkB family carbohydrate kinase n=1 Tax=Streptomyces sp. SAS_281 TaxID=3412744 RepID=UPI00403C4511
MERLDVIGNISRDRTRYPDGRGGPRLGGAALFLSLAATRAGRQAAPVCVLGDDLVQLPKALGLGTLDWTALIQVEGASTTFDLEYDVHGELVGVHTEYGVAEKLTAHALRHVDQHPGGTYHVCCRRPLDVAAVLGRLAAYGSGFSVDFFLPSAKDVIRVAIPWLPLATTLFVNAAEYRLLERGINCGALPEVVITDGPRTAMVHHFGRQVASAVPPPSPVREVSGAGDTLAGTFLAYRSQGATAAQALAEATSAAARYVSAPPHPIPAPRRG